VHPYQTKGRTRKKEEMEESVGAVKSLGTWPVTAGTRMRRRGN